MDPPTPLPCMKESESSSTALLIARATVLAETLPQLQPALLPESAAWSRRWLISAGGAGWFNGAMKRAWARKLLFKAQQFLVPGLFLHFFTRKRLLERFAREAIAAGCRQVVIIGAGLDSMAWRLPAEFTSGEPEGDRPQVRWFELDHPDTQRIKLRSQKDLGTLPGTQPRLLPLDLRISTPAEALSACSAFDAALPTFFVAEGLLMYLPPERVENFVSGLARLAAQGSRFAFTFMEQRKGERLAFRHGHPLIDTWLRWRQEPFQWGMPRAQESVEAFAAKHGWQLAFLSSHAGMRREILAPLGLEDEPLAEGESIALLTLNHPHSS